MKWFLLTAGSNYYPSAGVGDWIGTYSTYKEAESKVKRVNQYGRNYYVINDNEEYSYDWYFIIDLRVWVEDV